MHNCLTLSRGCSDLPSGGEGCAEGRGEYHFYLPNSLFGGNFALFLPSFPISQSP